VGGGGGSEGVVFEQVDVWEGLYDAWPERVKM